MGGGTNLAGGTMLDLLRGRLMASGEGKLVPYLWQLRLCLRLYKGFALDPPEALPLDSSRDCHPCTLFTMLRIVAAFFFYSNRLQS